MAERPRFIVAERLNDAAMAALRDAGDIVLLERCDEPTLMDAVKDADALIVRTYSHVTAAVMDSAKTAGRLRVIARAGVGLDNVDVRAALDRGLIVVHTPAASTHAVADHAVGLILALQRGIVRFDPLVRGGEFAKLRSDAPLAVELRHQTLGVIGMGRIGRALSTRLHDGFGTRIIYHDIRPIGWLPFPAESQPAADDVYAQADVVSMHVPLTARTRGMIDAAALAKFKTGSYLINTSRGPVVDAAALADALRQGRLAGAAIDVFEPEPPPPGHPLLTAPNCILSPHVASRTKEGAAAMNDVVHDVIGIVQGKEPMYPADPEVC